MSPKPAHVARMRLRVTALAPDASGNVTMRGALTYSFGMREDVEITIPKADWLEMMKSIARWGLS